MKIFKRFTTEAEAAKHGRRKGAFIPREIERQFPDNPYWLQFEHEGKRYRLKLDGAQTRTEAERMAKQVYAKTVHLDARYRHLKGDMPFTELMEHYLTESQNKASFPKLEQRARRKVRVFRQPTHWQDTP